MKDHSQPTSVTTVIHGLLFAALLILTFSIYQQGISGSFHFDDSNSLKGLLDVNDTSTAIDYVFSGQAGPTGRPLSLATFLLHADAWPDNPAPFLLTNILIHILNGALLGWMVYSLMRLYRLRTLSPGFVALAVSAIWLLSPILASASLMVVQRMTLLSATFVLAGLVLYLKGRILSLERPRAGYVIMSLGIGIGTLLATLAKENGVLLPVYALILELTLLQRSSGPVSRNFIVWKRLFLYLPTLAITSYFVIKWPSILDGYQHREFSLLERVLTEAQIQWDYLKLLILPKPHSFIPFYDNYPILSPEDGIASLVPALAWFAVLISALLLSRRAPLYTFAVFWYLLGHSLESTVIPLELYFEHRNYVPVIGPILALFLCLDYATLKQRGLVYTFTGAYILVIAFSLVQVTTLWGDPRLSGEVWYFNNRGSIRAAEYLEKQYYDIGDIVTYNKIVEESFRENPDNAGVALQHMSTTCGKLDPETWSEQRTEFGQLLAAGTFSTASTRHLDNLVSVVSQGECPALNLEDLHFLARMLQKNEHYELADISRHNLLLVQFRIYYLQKDYPNTIEHIMKAYKANPNLDTLKLVVNLLSQAGRSDTALEFLEQERLRPRKKLAERRKWRQSVDLLIQNINT